jgi:hypothetical protein
LRPLAASPSAAPAAPSSAAGAAAEAWQRLPARLAGDELLGSKPVGNARAGDRRDSRRDARDAPQARSGRSGCAAAAPRSSARQDIWHCFSGTPAGKLRLSACGGARDAGAHAARSSASGRAARDWR